MLNYFFYVLEFVRYYYTYIRNLIPVFLVMQPLFLFFTSFGCNFHRTKYISILHHSWIITTT